MMKSKVYEHIHIFFLVDIEGKRLVHVDYSVEPSDSEENSRVVENGELPSPVRLDVPLHLDCPSPEVKQQLAFLDIQAQVKQMFILFLYSPSYRTTQL